MAPFSHGLGRLSEKILLDLRDRIQQGRYLPGQKLPKETELCEQYGASRSTVRRAIARLVDDGTITVRKRAGMFVRQTPGAPQTQAGASQSHTIAVMAVSPYARLEPAQTYAITSGYLLSFYFQFERHFDSKTERAFLENVHAERYRALLAACTPLSRDNDDLLEALTAQGTRVIHIEPYTDDLPGQEFLLPDYHQAGYMAVTKGLLAGYEHFLFSGMRNDGPWARQQKAGFAAALADHAAGFDEEAQFYDFPRMGDEEDGPARVHRKAKSLPANTLVYCRSAHIAQYWAEALDSLGRPIAQDIGLLASDSDQSGLEAHVDLIGFDFEAILMKALEAAVNRSNDPLRTLIPPSYMEFGTLRPQPEPGSQKENHPCAS